MFFMGLLGVRTLTRVEGLGLLGFGSLGWSAIHKVPENSVAKERV